MGFILQDIKVWRNQDTSTLNLKYSPHQVWPSAVRKLGSRQLWGRSTVGQSKVKFKTFGNHYIHTASSPCTGASALPVQRSPWLQGKCTPSDIGWGPLRYWLFGLTESAVARDQLVLCRFIPASSLCTGRGRIIGAPQLLPSFTRCLLLRQIQSVLSTTSAVTSRLGFFTNQLSYKFHFSSDTLDYCLQ